MSENASGQGPLERPVGPLLERLREAETDYTVAWGSGDLYGEAADAIERLESMEDAAKEAYGTLVRAKDDLNGECSKLRDNLRCAHDVIMHMTDHRRTMRDLLLLARAEVLHYPECVPHQPCTCPNGELMRRIDAELAAE